MHSGLDRIGRAGMLALLLLPPLCYVAIRMGTRAYCDHAARIDASRRLLLANLPDMESALVQARLALHPLRATEPGDPGRAEEFGRWLLETAKSQKVDLSGLIINPAPSDPLTPALSASFRCEQDLVGAVRLFQNLQADSRVVIFDSIKLRLVGQRNTPRYQIEARLRSHAIAAPVGH